MQKIAFFLKKNYLESSSLQPRVLKILNKAIVFPLPPFFAFNQFLQRKKGCGNFKSRTSFAISFKIYQKRNEMSLLEVRVKSHSPFTSLSVIAAFRRDNQISLT
ncbi:MAG: hypothetical protein CR988_02860 [Treponema sp.]|nr:MAG: hypothetical protein CR988_02860 [Treponema sp.]